MRETYLERLPFEVLACICEVYLGNESNSIVSISLASTNARKLFRTFLFRNVNLIHKGPLDEGDLNYLEFLLRKYAPHRRHSSPRSVHLALDLFSTPHTILDQCAEFMSKFSSPEQRVNFSVKWARPLCTDTRRRQSAPPDLHATSCDELHKDKFDDNNRVDHQSTVVVNTNEKIGALNNILALDVEGFDDVRNACPFRWLRSTPYLRFLSLRSCRELSYAKLRSIFDFSQLEHLNLESCRAIHPWEKCYRCEQVSDRLLQGLPDYCPKLRWVSIARCTDVTDEGAFALARLTCTLEHVDISYCRAISERGIARILSKCDRLTSLVASHCNVLQDALGTAFNQVASRELRVVKMDGLRHASSDSEGALYGMLTMVRRCRECPLETLSIAHGARLDSEVVDAIVDFFGTSLRSLNFSYAERVGPALAVSTSFKRLERCALLQDLRMDGLKASDIATPLVSIVAACKGLRYLSLENTGVCERRVDKWRQKKCRQCSVRNSRGRVIPPANRFFRRRGPGAKKTKAPQVAPCGV